MSKRKHWTPQEEDQLRSLYPTSPMTSLVEILGRPITSIRSKAKLLGVRRAPSFFAGQHSGRLQSGSTTGAASQFRKGNQPWNKGKAVTAGGRSAETRFKPGTLQGKAAILAQPVGTERVTQDGIRQRKITAEGPMHRRWRAVHAILWEETNGPIPRGHVVIFKDKNCQNIVLENLELVTRQELMQRNSIHRYPEELKTTIRQLGKLKRAISEAAS